MSTATSTAASLPTVSAWKNALNRKYSKISADRPNYYAVHPESLITQCQVHAFMTGTGEDIYGQLQKSIESATQEVILVTCFWASSTSLDSLVQALRALSSKVDRHGLPKIRIFIGFSSVSILQKLLQTSSLRGKQYSAPEAAEKLGLPVSELPGLDFTVKSIFVRPFSVMHPKFVVIDRKLVWLPSCNVSWERWFEGGIALSGDIVSQFVRFWENFWESSSATDSQSSHHAESDGDGPILEISDSTTTLETAEFSPPVRSDAIFLPSPHHWNPRFCLPLLQRPAACPPTPLSTFQLIQMRTAVSSIFIQTPNLNAAPVLDELLEALRRGVNVHIVTSEKLMILEQLVTAGTTGARAIAGFVRRYEMILPKGSLDVEAGMTPRGTLLIHYFQPRNAAQGASGDPDQSHLKLSIFDDEVVVLGSQNMDRASWYTSQELGVAFISRDLAKSIRRNLATSLEGRTKVRYGFE